MEIVTISAELWGYNGSEVFYIISDKRDMNRNKKKLVDTLHGLALARNYPTTKEDIESTVEYDMDIQLGEVYKQ